MRNAVILGTFDGLHKGHRAVIDAAKGYRTVAVTFDLPPKFILSGESGLLMMPDDKKAALKRLGADEICSLDFEKVRNTDALTFINDIIDTYNPEIICCGFNYRFGRNAHGTPETVKEVCAQRGIKAVCVEPVFEDGKIICSTEIRRLIRNGETERANREIYGGFSFSSEVLHGDMRGRTIGFPTVNQMYPSLLTVPKLGVYASKIIICGKEYAGISNIGVRPTYKTEKIMSETYVLDFDREIYGKTVTLKPQRFLRAEKRFSGLSELKAALENDIKALEEE